MDPINTNSALLGAQFGGSLASSTALTNQFLGNMSGVLAASSGDQQALDAFSQPDSASLLTAETLFAANGNGGFSGGLGALQAQYFGTNGGTNVAGGILDASF